MNNFVLETWSGYSDVVQRMPIYSKSVISLKLWWISSVCNKLSHIVTPADIPDHEYGIHIIIHHNII